MVSQITFLFCSLVTLDDLTLSLDSLSDPSNVTISLSHETQLFVTLLKLLIFLVDHRQFKYVHILEKHWVSQISGCCLIDGVLNRGPTHPPPVFRTQNVTDLVIHVAKLSSAICVRNYSIKKWSYITFPRMKYMFQSISGCPGKTHLF